MGLSFVFSLLSIFFGVCALVFAIINVLQSKEKIILYLTSMSLASFALIVQIIGIRYSILVLEDYSAVIDTVNVLSWVCFIFIVIIVLLNTLAYVRQKRKL